MRWLAASFVLVGCAADPSSVPAPQPGGGEWSAIAPGDLIVLVPGTGSYAYLAQPIEALAGPDPVVDVRAVPKVAGDSIVFEEAIAAAERAGVSTDELAFGIWGTGITQLDGFEYVSFEGIHIHVAVLGGENSCATGDIFQNLGNYKVDSARADATDLNARVAAWRATHPDRGVVYASHSWGGAVAEYLALEHLSETAPLAIAAGVPSLIIGYTFEGPGLHVSSDRASAIYEIDRPDDPVHALDPLGNGAGHYYNILFGDVFQGFYDLTTTAISCSGVPGPCS